MNAATPILVQSLYAGHGATLPDGTASGIYKRRVTGRRRVDQNGLAGDEQADHEHHAGSDRVLCHYPAEHYEHWRRLFAPRDDFVPGVFGENLSTLGMTEADVAVGDVFSLGTAIIRITQPRQPCWKIGSRMGIKTLARDLVEAGRAGWLYRVVEPGKIGAGDRLMRVEAAAHGISLARLWALNNARVPDRDARAELRFLADYPGLAAGWRHRLARKLH